MSKRSSILLAFGVCLALLASAGGAAAAPAPPMTAVNHETKECGQFPGGDECAICRPTGGWELLDNGFDVECPEDYASASPSYACDPVKAPHCCTEGHSGAPGDCADLIISHRHDQCAFVDDIEGCKPPREWTRQPNGRRAEDWQCPADYEWIDDLSCSGEESTESTEDADGISIPCLGTLLVGPVLGLLWLGIKRHS
jgi:hypothetical protein